MQQAPKSKLLALLKRPLMNGFRREIELDVRHALASTWYILCALTVVQNHFFLKETWRRTVCGRLRCERDEMRNADLDRKSDQDNDVHGHLLWV